MNSLFRLISAIAFVFCFSEISRAQQNPPTPIEQQPSDLLAGHWVSESILYNQGVELHTTFDFTQTTMTLTGTCVFPAADPVSLTAAVNTRIVFDGNDLYIQETKNTNVDDGYRYCRVYVQPARWQFYFNGTGKAVLIAPVPYQSRFVLVR